MGIQSALIAAICLNSALYSADLDLKLLAHSDTVDIVTPDNAPPYAVYLPRAQTGRMITPDAPASFNIAPAIRFFDASAKRRAMGIIPLANDGVWLNASAYDRLELDGSCPGCTLALADAALFEKEDNLAVGSFAASIPLYPLYGKIDLHRLKYLVIFTDHPESVKITSLRLRKTPSAPSGYMTGVWVWHPRDIDIKRLRSHGIKRIYLQMNGEFEGAAKMLHRAGFEVYALDGDPGHIDDPLPLYTAIERIARLNRHGSVVRGFQIDVEPHTRPDFNIRREHYAQKFLMLVRSLGAQCRQSGLNFSVVIPFWYDELRLFGRPLSDHIIDSADETVLMSYRSNLREVISVSASELAYAESQHKTVRIGIELMPIPNERHAVYKATDIAETCTTEKQIPQCLTSQPLHTYTVKGSEIRFDRQSNRLSELRKSRVPYRSFGGFVLHHAGGL